MCAFYTAVHQAYSQYKGLAGNCGGPFVLLLIPLLMQSFIKNIMIFMKKIHSCPHDLRVPGLPVIGIVWLNLQKTKSALLVFLSVGLFWD